MADFTFINKFSSLPEDLKRQVEDFVDFLKTRSVPKKPEKKQRVLGLAKGMITMKAGFDDPIEDFKDYV